MVGQLRGTFPPPCGTLRGTFSGAKRPVPPLKRPATSGTLGNVSATASPNERLRTAMQRTNTTIDDLALCCGVDPKSVERWLSLGRVPHRANRWDAARRLGYDDDYLWPDAPGRDQARRDGAAQSELVRLYPDRGSVPRATWHQLFGDAREEISILVHAGLFIAEDPVTRRLLAEQARAGVRVRMMLGDPSSALVAKRGEEEGIGTGTVAAKVRNALSFLRHLAEQGLIEIRLHDTTLYNSIYRADDQVIVNAHVYGNTAACAPVLHLRKVSGGSLVTTYTDCTECVWEQAKPWNGEDA
jgi:Domain of unknown function (DUF5919)